MKYNTRIENLLCDLVNSDVRYTDDITSTKYIHDNQINAAKEIVKSFTAHIQPQDEHDARNNHVVLVAKMQSGKTGTCNAVINIMKKTRLQEYFGIEKYLYITGMNDNGLHKQTVERLYSDDGGQVLGATIDTVCNGDSEIRSKPNAMFYVQKNYDLRKNNIQLSNCLIFIDESHFGSNKTNVLTKFLEENGIDWKNNKILKEKQIYIVSVSATPFDEVVSDIVKCKAIVVLKTNDMYIGVTEYIENDCILPANRCDFKLDKETNKIPIIEYIIESHSKIINNNNKGVLFIRTRDTKIKNHSFIKDNFKVVELDTHKGSSIDYNLAYNDIQAMIDATYGSQTNKPIIFFVKGAFKAGITLNSSHKDYVFMVYDNCIKSETTAQGLLGRMCGYRKNKDDFKKTMFYINKQHAEDYSEWEKDFTDRSNVPSEKTWRWVDSDYNDTQTEIKIATKCNRNFTIQLSDEQIKRFVNASLNKDVKNKEFSKNELRLLLPSFNFDYFGESYISGKNAFSQSVIEKWFTNFNIDDYCNSYRPDSYFKQTNNREELSIKDDLGKIICHLVLDTEVLIDDNDNIYIQGNKRLLVYHGILCKKAKIKNNTNRVKTHFTTSTNE